MKKYLYLLFATLITVGLNACSPDDNEPDNPQTETPETPDNPNPAPTGKTLIVYYSYTNNVHSIINDLQTQIEADVVRVEPTEKGIDYAANNYAIGSALIQAIRDNPNDANSYPSIETTIDNLSDYDRIIIGAPLWWSNMAAPLQTFLFQYGSQMEGKNIGLIVSSASSGINGVESDAKRLIPGGNFLTPSLWIRSSQTSNCHSMIADWLNEIN
ncbi:flavodoxin [Parabacteroides faecis]|uniref:flavodoxin n=1 Tax=Parabacteroides faecis TaxID=1217282 RepID=UPI00352060A3